MKTADMKNWIQKHLIATWALCSVLFAVIIHLLFHWETNIAILHAKWSAGDILTYASTVALGLLALWQNKRFKEENDAAQKRLEKLSEQSNQLALVTKIIEIEYDHLSRIRAVFNEFSSACDPQIFSQVYVQGDTDLEISARMLAADKRLDDSYVAVYREVTDFTVNDRNSLTSAINNYFDAAKDLANKCRLKPMVYYNDELQRLNAAKKRYMGERETYLRRKKENLNKAIYESLSLEEMKRLFLRGSVTDMEENPNGTHEI